MQTRIARTARTKAWAFLSIATICVTAACSSLLDVKSPDAIDPASLDIPANASLLVNSSIGDFFCSYGSYVVASGLMSGELEDGTLTAARWSYDRRDLDPNEALYSTNDCTSLGTYTPISTARYTADHVLGLLEGWSDTSVNNRQELIAKAATFGGYSRILLGEGFCSAAIDLGPQLTSQQLFDLAIGKLDTAVTAAQSSGVDSLVNLALVGRARAELDAGHKAAAATDAALVPSGFVYYVTSDKGTAQRANRVYTQNNAGHSVTVAPAYRGLGDPRVPVTDEHRAASDEQSPLFTQGKYVDGSASIPLASYIEAQLILAEATGGSGAITILNNLRATASLSPLTSSSDPVVISADIGQERARWLWLQGTHYFDVRRLGLPLVPAAGTPYTPEYTKGGVYGSETCMPIPAVETNNNPNARNPPAG
ncbi:MAG: RagB/SusD family nutrient uptake outer membrane protein [Gemmatimonadaceae bacterium]